MKPRRQSSEYQNLPGGPKVSTLTTRDSHSLPGSEPTPPGTAEASVPEDWNRGKTDFRGDTESMSSRSAIPPRQKRSKEETSTEQDPRHHTKNVKAMMRDLIDHLRNDVRLVNDPKAQALFETSAEVLVGLTKAFDDYEKKNEEAWRK